MGPVGFRQVEPVFKQVQDVSTSQDAAHGAHGGFVFQGLKQDAEGFTEVRRAEVVESGPHGSCFEQGIHLKGDQTSGFRH